MIKVEIETSKQVLPFPIAYHIPKIKGLGRKFQSREHVKGEINNKDKDNKAIIAVLRSYCREGQHEE